MEIKEKTALITLSLNVLLTILKFLLFLISGSLAVLAEAWHSLTDIVTSFLVYIAVHQDNASKEQEETVQDSALKKESVKLEQVAALGVGGFLLVVAVFLMGKFFGSTPQPVKNPLIAGVIFLAFALGSYLVYRFESSVGRQESSVGLMSDGMHARTDMIASLLTGFSLILYYLGLDIDKWIAGIIALFVLAYAVETIVNVTLSIIHKKRDTLFQYKFYHILGRVLSPSGLVSLGRFLDQVLHVRLFSSKLVRKSPIILLCLAVLIMLGFWLNTCTFTVAPSEQAFIERFGKPLNPTEPLEPGLHFKAPWPIDRAVKEETRAIRRMNIGNMTEPNTFALLWTQKHGTEIPFLSGDNNYFYPYLVLHYRIKNLYDYLYRNENPEPFMEGVAHQIVYKLFAQKTFFDIACIYRKQLVDDFMSELQSVLDHESTRVGIEIVDIAIKDIHPPIMIADSYEVVIASIQEKERMINEALGYRNQNLPETRGEAVRMRKEAEAYAQEVPTRAGGDAGQFLSRIPETEAVRKITQERLWLSAMESALKNRSKIVIDPAVGQPELWLDMKGLFKTPSLEFDQGQY